LPLFALVAATAHGESRVRGAAELRVKESDRIESVATALRTVGVRIAETPDGFTVRGVPGRLRGGTIDARGDHRIAMLGALAGLLSSRGVDVRGAGWVEVSYPSFFEVLDSLRTT
ncbi:MAG: 3-phosphoshikimate 1-carboxyvinyltransferase, partial [Gaiellales bacterium]